MTEVFTHQIHLVSRPQGELWVWIERVAGHRIITDLSELTPDDLPWVLLKELRRFHYRQTKNLWLATPKGRLRRVGVPVAALEPERAVRLLQILCEYVNEHSRGAGGLCPGLAPESVYICDLFAFTDALVRSGRLLIGVEKVDDAWYPRWTIAPGDHQETIAAFDRAAPGVITKNTPADPEGSSGPAAQFAEGIAHWIALSYLQRDRHLTGELANDFVRGLVTGKAAKRVAGATVTHLGQWRASALRDAFKLVLILSDPDAVAQADLDEPTWRLDIGYSLSNSPVQPAVAAEVPDSLKTAFRVQFKRAQAAWEPLTGAAVAVATWLQTGIWMPTADLLTGDYTRDRTLGMTLQSEGVVDLLTHGVDALKTVGVDVMVPRGWTRVQPNVRTKVIPVGQGPGSGKVGLDQLLDFSVDVSLGGYELTEEEQRTLMESASTIVQLGGHYVYLDRTALQRAQQWIGAVTGTDEDESLIDGPTTVTLRDVLAADALDPSDNAAEHVLTIEAEGWVSRLLRGQAEVAPMQAVDIPQTVITPLRDHQRRGVNWLAWMAQHGVGAVLADDMGLGKTLQILALVAWEKAQGTLDGPKNSPVDEGAVAGAVPVESAVAGAVPVESSVAGAVPAESVGLPTLVVAPTSVVEAWKSEAHRHVPSLRVLVDHGRVTDDESFTASAPQHDVVVTTYGRVQRNTERYAQVEWGRVVADEAQAIKNPVAKQTQAVKSLRALHRIALTGTPVENRLADLYSLLDFVNPGLLGSAAAFQNRVAIPIERYGDEEARERLRRLVSPFLLRRLKTDTEIGLDLPQKTEIVQKVPLSPEQATLYKAYIDDIEQRLRDRTGDRRGNILGALVRIKQICNHPAHFAGDGSALMYDGKHRSGKVQKAFEILEQARQDGRKALIFTQFPSFGAMLLPELERMYGQPIPMLHGGVPRKKRAQMVQQFQSPNSDGPPAMVLSVRAGGTGITLTEASVVVHIDLWWNPAVEDQATDRAYRIGQNRDVTVYKLVVEGTLDERINDIISGKRELAGGIIGTGEGWIANLGDDELKELWRLRTATEEARGASAETKKRHRVHTKQPRTKDGK